MALDRPVHVDETADGTTGAATNGGLAYMFTSFTLLDSFGV